MSSFLRVSVVMSAYSKDSSFKYAIVLGATAYLSGLVSSLFRNASTVSLSCSFSSGSFFWLRWSDTHIDFLPCLKAGDSYSGQLNEALRFGGFPLRWRPRCDRLAPVSVLRRLHGRLTTPRVPRRRGYSVRRSNHGRAVCRIAGIPIRVRPTVSCHPCVRIGSRFGCWDTSGRCV